MMNITREDKFLGTVFTFRFSEHLLSSAIQFYVFTLRFHLHFNIIVTAFLKIFYTFTIHTTI